MVGVRGFEPPTTASRTQCATRLRYTPTARKALWKPHYGKARGSTARQGLRLSLRRSIETSDKRALEVSLYRKGGQF